LRIEFVADTFDKKAHPSFEQSSQCRYRGAPQGRQLLSRPRPQPQSCIVSESHDRECLLCDLVSHVLADRMVVCSAQRQCRQGRRSPNTNRHQQTQTAANLNSNTVPPPAINRQSISSSDACVSVHCMYYVYMPSVSWLLSYEKCCVVREHVSATASRLLQDLRSNKQSKTEQSHKQLQQRSEWVSESMKGKSTHGQGLSVSVRAAVS
jgi:hypothetical protein